MFCIINGMIDSVINLRKELNLHLCLAILLLLTLPFSIRIPNILLLLISAHWLFFQKRKRIASIKVLAILLLPFLMYSLGIIYSDDVSEGFYGLEKRLPLLAFPIIFSTMIFSQKQIELLLTAFLIGTIAATLYCVLFEVINHYHAYDRLYPVNFDYFKLSELTQGIELDPPYFGAFIGFSLLIASFLFQRKVIGLASFILTVIFLSPFLVLSGARTAMLALLVSMAAFWIMHQKKKAIGILVIIALSLSLIVMADDVLRNRFVDAVTLSVQPDNQASSSLSVRLATWKSALSIIEDNWLLGVGTGDYQVALNKAYLEDDLREAYENEYNVHNQYLETMVALGIAGLICFMLSFALSVTIAGKTQSSLFLSFMILVLTCLTTESMLERHKGIMLFAFFNSLFVFSSHRPPEKIPDSN